MHDPFRDFQHALAGGGPLEDEGSAANLDTRRERRTGMPEVVFAEPKTAAQVVAIARRLLDESGRAILSRVPPATMVALEQAFDEVVEWESFTAAQMVVLRKRGQERKRTGGQVGILTAGTADLPRAEEAAVLCREVGCDVHIICDVGVAGLHRLVGPLRRLLAVPVDAIIVAAGMDGALPSVVAGLVDVPVIGLPTSVGYGLGGNGEAALMSMLQTCAPGLAVVNIDNGIGAGAVAARIANRLASARSGDG